MGLYVWGSFFLGGFQIYPADGSGLSNPSERQDNRCERKFTSLPRRHKTNVACWPAASGR